MAGVQEFLVSLEALVPRLLELRERDRVENFWSRGRRGA